MAWKEVEATTLARANTVTVAEQVMDEEAPGDTRVWADRVKMGGYSNGAVAHSPAWQVGAEVSLVNMEMASIIEEVVEISWRKTRVAGEETAYWGAQAAVTVMGKVVVELAEVVEPAVVMEHRCSPRSGHCLQQP